jgi:long-chain acyl-CoA synthetase
MNIAHLLARAAAAYPNDPAILKGTRACLTYKEFASKAACIAGYLRNELGMPPGERVALFMTNCPEYLEVLYGALWAGLVVVPVNAKLHPQELAYVLEHSGSTALFLTPDLASEAGTMGQYAGLKAAITTQSAGYAKLAQAEAIPLEHRAPDDTAWLFYTSGTTGRPKGVMQTHRNLMGMTSCYFTDVDPVARQDCIVYAAPMSHGAGLYNFAHVLKATRHVIPESGGFDPAELCHLAAELGNLSLFAAPTMVKRLVNHIQTENLGSDGFKTIVYGGGPMYVEDIQQALRVMGNRFVQIYGQGECPMTITALSREQIADRDHPNWLNRLGSVGMAQSLVEIRIADDQGQPLPAGETGEILVRSDIVMAGYWNDPQATAKTLNQGWLHTGDMGSLDEHGLLTLKDRSKDVIISGGSNIYPREVEEALLKHARVSEVSVVGQPDPEWGEVVVAFVVGNATESELNQLCLNNIARFKRPKRYVFLPALPKNNYGKVLKTELRTLLNHSESKATS